LGIASRELHDASLSGISTDGKFDHAYAAVRSLCDAALHAAGFQVPKGQRQHERVIESLKYTVGGRWAAQYDYLDRCRRKRHQNVYDTVGLIQEQDAEDLLETARSLYKEVLDWLKANHPKVSPDTELF